VSFSAQPSHHGRQHHHEAPPQQPQMKIVPGAITFQNADTMIQVLFYSVYLKYLIKITKLQLLQMSSASPVGTIAFLLDEEALLVRVRSGWQYIAVSVWVCSWSRICSILAFCSLVAWSLLALLHQLKLPQL